MGIFTPGSTNPAYKKRYFLHLPQTDALKETTFI